MKVEFYTKEICSLCDDAYALLKMIQSDYPFELMTYDIYQDDQLLEKYQLLIPAVQIGDVFLNCEEINYESLESTIRNLSQKS